MGNAFIGWLQKKAQQDIVAPIQRDVVQPVEHVAAAIPAAVKAPVQTVVAPVLNHLAMSNPLGRVDKAIVLGGARAGVGIGQAASGLTDLATPGTGTSGISKDLNKEATSLDTTVKTQHLNPIAYHGAQIAANLVPTGAIEKGVGEAVNAIPKVGELAPKVEDLTKGLEDSGHVGRIAANAIRGATSVKNLGVNAGYQAFNAGQQAAQGKHVNPVSQAESLGVYQTGFPLLGAASKEALNTVAPVIAKTARGVISAGKEPALAGAEKASGLSRNALVNDNEANTLRDEASRVMGDKVGNATQTAQQAHAIVKNIGLDITSGAPADRASRIENYLSQRRSFVTAHNQIAQGGYAKFPFPEEGESEIHPLSQSYGAENSSQGIAKNTADGMYSHDKTAKGGIVLPDSTRTTEHTPFYSSFYKENGKAPTKNDYLAEVTNQLESGGGDLATKEESDAYQLAKGREAANPTVGLSDSVDQSHAPLTTVETQPSANGAKEQLPPSRPTQTLSTPQESGELQPNDESIVHNQPAVPSKAATADKEESPQISPSKSIPNEPLSKEQYAEIFDLTPLQANKDFEDMALAKTNQPQMSEDELAQLGPKQTTTIADKRELIANDPKQATENKVTLNPLTRTDISLKDRARSAIAQAEGINQEAEYRLQRAVQLGKNLSDHDRQLLYKYDDGANIDDLTNEADKPAQFNKVAHAYADATDYDLSARRAGYEPTLNQTNYVPHNYAVSEAWMDAHKIPEDQRIYDNGEIKGFRDTSAKYPSYAKAYDETNGFLQPLKADPVEDLEDYMKRGGISRRNNLLSAALGKAAPDDVGTLNTTRVGDKNMTQAAGKLPFSASDDLQKQLKGYKHEASTVSSKALQKVSSASKKLLFLGTPFHYVNEQASFIGKNLLNPKNLAIGEKRFLLNAVTKGGYQKLLDEASADGTLEAIRKMGVVLPDANRLERASSVFSLTEAQAALKKGLDPESKEAVDLGQQINHLMGHRNLAVEAEDPQKHKILSLGTLAPSWSTTQLGLVKDALTKGGKAGNYARGAILGKRALLAGVGIGGSAALSHKLPTVSQALNEAGFTLNNTVPNIELNTKNKSNGESQEMALPTDPLGLAAGLLPVPGHLSNPEHFISSRESPIVSLGTKLLTNQNWNGEPLATAQPNTPEYYKQLVENAAKNSLLPIGAQNVTNLTHAANNPDLLQGIAQDFGGRLKTNPNDPNYVATQKYFNAINKVEGSLNAPADAGTLSTVSNYLQSYKNANGQTEEKAPGETMARWQTLSSDPKALAAIQKVQLSSNDPSPEWQLPSTGNGGTYIGADGKQSTTSKLQVYAMYESMVNGDANRTQLEQLNPWLPKVFTAEQDWFNTGAAKGTVQPYSGPLPGGLTTKDLQYPNLSSTQNSMMNQVSQLSSIPATNRTPLQTKQLSNLENNSQLQSAYTALDTYTNNMRVAKGYSPLNYAPSEPPAVTAAIATYDALPAGTGARTAWIKANQDLYTQVENYYAGSDQATIDKAGALAELAGEQPTSSQLGAEYDAGQYDIAKTTNPNGTSTYSINPTLAYSQGSGGSGSSKVINPGYELVHALVATKKPHVVKLNKENSIATPIKATYKKTKVVVPSVHASTIGRGMSHNIGRKPAVAGLA